MTPQEFLEKIVEPNIVAFRSQRDDLGLAFNAVLAVDALAAHIFYSSGLTAPVGPDPDTWYRNELARQSVDFRLLRDIAKAQKHVRLSKHKPLVSNADQLRLSPSAFDPRAFQNDAFQVGSVCIEMNDANSRDALRTIEAALKVLKSEMVRFNISENLDTTVSE